LPKGTVVVDRGVVRYNGDIVDNSLTTRIVRIAVSGKPIDPWIKFMENLYANPNHTTRAELYDWLAGCSLPLTTDGHFIAYKRVRENYTDVYSGTFDHSIGEKVAMANRAKVDPVRTNTCSTGLHFCSPGYLPHFSGARCLILKINPADVVSIPVDYQYTKGRAWRYEVVGEIRLEEALSKEWPAVVAPSEYELRLVESLSV
jgi:hypothetical protein